MVEGELPCRLWVGVAGHRDVEETPALRETVSRILVQLGMPEEPDDPDRQVWLGVVTCAAEGADRVLAHQLLEQAGSALEVILPMPAEDYSTDFSSEESDHEFRELLERADFVQTGPGSGPRKAGYVWAAHRLVKSCDVLIIVWDGAVSRGPGGTADLVEIAREATPAIPVFHIDSVSSQEIAPPSVGIGKLTDDINRTVAWNRRYHRWRGRHHEDRSLPDWYPRDVRSGVAAFDGFFHMSDGRARWYQRLFQGGTLFVFFGAAIATCLAAMQIIDETLWWPRAELIVLLLVLAVTSTLGWTKAHQHWLDARAIAEWCRGSTHRHLTSSANPTNVARAAHGMSPAARWLGHLCDEIWLSRPDPPGIKDLAAVKELCLEWVNGQSRYHSRQATYLRRCDQALEAAVWFAFAVTVVVVVWHLWEPSFGPHVDSSRFIVAAVSMPAIGGALAALRASRDYARNADRSELAASDLQDLGEQLEGTSDQLAIHHLVTEIAQRLARENRDWLNVMLYHDVELHV